MRVFSLFLVAVLVMTFSACGDPVTQQPISVIPDDADAGHTDAEESLDTEVDGGTEDADTEDDAIDDVDDGDGDVDESDTDASGGSGDSDGEEDATENPDTDTDSGGGPEDSGTGSDADSGDTGDAEGGGCDIEGFPGEGKAEGICKNHDGVFPGNGPGE